MQNDQNKKTCNFLNEHNYHSKWTEVGNIEQGKNKRRKQAALKINRKIISIGNEHKKTDRIGNEQKKTNSIGNEQKKTKHGK